MVQKIHPWGVIWVPSSHLMWADQLKKIDSSSVHIYKEVHAQAIAIWLLIYQSNLENIFRQFA